MSEQQHVAQWTIEKADFISKAKLWEQRCVEAEDTTEASKKRMQLDLEEKNLMVASLQSQMQAFNASALSAKSLQEQALREEQEHSARLLATKEMELDMLKVELKPLRESCIFL